MPPCGVERCKAADRLVSRNMPGSTADLTTYIDIDDIDDPGEDYMMTATSMARMFDPWRTMSSPSPSTCASPSTGSGPNPSPSTRAQRRTKMGCFPFLGRKQRSRQQSVEEALDRIVELLETIAEQQSAPGSALDTALESALETPCVPGTAALERHVHA